MFKFLSPYVLVDLRTRGLADSRTCRLVDSRTRGLKKIPDA
jgi:hypothetical protein